MKYSKLQKIISSFLLLFFFFGQITGLSIFSLFSNTFASNKKFHDIVSIIVEQEVYDELDSEIKRYARDIQKNLENTKTIILPIGKDTSAFSISSMNESLFYEGYKSLKKVDFESRLIGTVLIGDFSLPLVGEDGKTIKSIIPFTDFEDKSFIYNHKNGIYEKNTENIDGLKSEIWHGVISPNTGNKKLDIDSIRDFLDKDHSFYTGTDNFSKSKGVISGNKNYSVPEKYEPYVFYFDEIREQKSINYPAYKGYESYLENREDLAYNRYSKELAQKIKDKVLGAQGDELQKIVGNIDDEEIKNAFSSLSGPDLGIVNDISTKKITDEVTNNFLEVLNKGTISDFRTNVHNAGRYNEGNSKVNVDIIPYLVTILDLVSDKVVKSANNDIENEIDDLVKNQLAKNIKIPKKIVDSDLICGDLEYTNYYNGLKASDLETAKDCSIYRGSVGNSGTLVEANRGVNPDWSENDSNLLFCKASNKGKNPVGVYGGSSPLNLDFDKISNSLNFELKVYDLKKAVLPVFDIKGSKKIYDVSKEASPKNCLDLNFIKTLDDDTMCGGFIFSEYDVLNENNNISFSNEWNCIKSNENYTGKIKDISGYINIPSYIEHKSPTVDEVNEQLEAKITPNLPIDKDRYIDFFSSPVDAVSKSGVNSYQKVYYPNFFRIIGEDKGDIKKQLENLLNSKSSKLNSIEETGFDLLNFLKSKPLKEVEILGEKKTISYYDYLVFSIYWNNLTNVSAKYKFIIENYLSDQVGGNDFDFLLAGNKKMYEIAYLGALGDAQNMYVKMDFDGENPYSDTYSRNSLLNTNKLSLGVINSSNKIGFDQEGEFKCAPPEGVPIWQWLPAVFCRLKGLLPPEISVGEGACGSSILEDSEVYELGKEIESCTESGSTVVSCLEKDIKNNSKLVLSSDSSRYFYNKRGKLKTEILDKNDKRILLDSSSYLSHNLKKIVDKTTNEVVFDAGVDDFYENLDLINDYIFFKPISIRSSYGSTYSSFSTKNKKSDIYFEANLSFKDTEGNLISIDSNEVLVKVRSERLFLSSYFIDEELNENIAQNSTISNEDTNVYLSLEKLKDYSGVNKNSLVLELLNLGDEGEQENINFPIKVSLKDSFDNLISSQEFSSFSSIKELYKIKKAGSYKIEIEDNYSYKVYKDFQVLASSPEELKLDLGTSLLQSSGSISTNLVSIYDKYSNIVSGEIYDFNLNLLGDNIIFEKNSEKSLDISGFEGYKAFRLKSLDKVGISDLRIDLYKDGEKLLSKSQKIRVIDNINIIPKFSDKLEVGNNKYYVDLEFRNKNNNLLTDLNSRVYLGVDSKYISLEANYTEIISGKSRINFSTKTLASESVLFNFNVEGFNSSFSKDVSIAPGKAMNIDLIPTKSKLEAITDSETYIKIELKDIYNNLVFNDSETVISAELLSKYSNILTLNSSSNILKGGKTSFRINATDLPGSAYLKFSTDKKLEDNEFIVGDGEDTITINGVSENAIQLETFFFYSKENIVGKKYNSLYSTLLGAEYGDISQKDYLAGAMLFDKNNRSLAVTSLLNNPYNFKDSINIKEDGTISKVYDSSDLSQDLEIKLKKDINNNYYLDLFNQALNIYIGKIYINYDNLNIKEDIYEVIYTSDSFNLKDLLNLDDISIYKAGNIPILDNFLKNKKDSLIIYLETAEYNSRDLDSRSSSSKAIYYKDPFAKEYSINSFASSDAYSYENFYDDGNLGWKAGNKSLLDFSAGKNVGDATKDYLGVSVINLGDPVISLKKINKQSNSIDKKFDSTIGKKLNKRDILGYDTFDYNADSREDILIFEDSGFLSLLENINSSSKFLDQKYLARIVDLGQKDSIKTGDFSGDKYEDIFFVNTSGDPFLLDNKEKDFIRIDLKEEFDLNGKIVQAESFDMDNDGVYDIITLDSFGELNIFYGKKNTNEFDKKTVYSGYGIKLNSETRSNLGAVYFDSLRNNLEDFSFEGEEDVIPIEMIENLMFEKIEYDQQSESNYEVSIDDLDSIDTESIVESTSFIKSEYASYVGLKVEKKFIDLNGGNLDSGDTVEVELKLKNVSSNTLNNIVYLENIPNYFNIDLDSIKTDEDLDFKKGINKYKFLIDKFDLSSGTEITIKYEIKTKVLKYSYMKVGLFEKDEAGDDEFGDILISASKYNCGGDSDIFRSSSERDYEKGIKYEKCDESELPEELEKNDIDNNENGIPDYIDEIYDSGSGSEYQKDLLDAYNEENKIDDDLDFFDNINKSVDDLSSDIDEFIEGFGCGFGGGSCFGLPVNWAPLAPGNDPVVLGKLVGDGLRINEGYPLFSGLTWKKVGKACVPVFYPVSSKATGCFGKGAGGSLGANSSTNFYRFFISPTLTGGMGAAACFGSPASAVGRVPPKGLNPVVPGGNCIVTAAKLPNLCEDEEIVSDPSSIGQVYYFGDSYDPNSGYGVINGNCNIGSYHKKISTSNKIDTSLAREYLNSRKSGTVSPELIGAFEENFADGGNSTAINEPLVSVNGGNFEASDISVSLDFFDGMPGINFKDVEQLQQDRVAAFPRFITQWVNDQLEEFITKLTDFPTLFIILPDFSKITNANWGKYTDELIKGTKEKYNSGVENSNSLLKQTSGIKEAYEFLGNVPFVSIEGEPVNINVPWHSGDLDDILTQRKLSYGAYKGELNRAIDSWTYNGICERTGSGSYSIKCNEGNSLREKNVLEAQKFMRSVEMNIQVLETYKRFPELLAGLAGKRQEYLEQILCNIESISELTNGWYYRNGKRFKAWVELYVLIKAILKSWQLLADIFIDYDAECHECKNERHNSLGSQFQLVNMIIPKIPVITFPKWPDLVLDLHNIRLHLTVVLPQFEFTKRPIILPPLPNLSLPEAPGVSLSLPVLPILPQLEVPELPDIPSLPTVKLPDLPPPPKLPKLFASIEGVLNILKLITKAMCILKKSPFVPETRAGDQIAFLTESSGYRPFDFIDMTLPNFTYPFVDEIRVTTYVNLEFETEFLVEMARILVEPVNNMSSNLIHMLRQPIIKGIDLGESVPSQLEYDINKNGDINTSYNNSNSGSENFAGIINKGIQKLDKNSKETISSKEFIESVNKQLSKEYIISDPKFDELRKSFDIVNNYTYSKEDEIIANLKRNNYEKFDLLKSIIKREISKEKDFKKEILDLERSSIYEKISNKEIDDIEIYNSSLDKYNKAFINSAKALINPSYLDQDELEKDGKEFINRISSGIKDFEKDNFKPTNLKLNTKNSFNKNNDYLALYEKDGKVVETCDSKDSDYRRNYEGIYIVQEEGSKKISYRLFDYLDDLDGNEITKEIDFDLDSDSDLLYSMDNNLYLKENLINNQNSKIYLSGVEVLDSDDNKFLEKDSFIEAPNNALESVVSNSFININFSSLRDDILNYRLEYYTIIDKYLNEGHETYFPKNIKKNIVDAFVVNEQDTFISENDGVLTNKNRAYIYEVGTNIANVKLKTKKLLNIKDSIKSGNVANIPSTTKLYAGGSSVKIKYFKDNSNKLEELKIDAYTNVEFAYGIKVVSSGDLFVSSSKDIILEGNDIYKYLKKPILFDSEIVLTNDNGLSASSHIGIKYYDESYIDIDFRKVSSYKNYNLGFVSDSYSINLLLDNDYLYSRLQAFSKGLYGTKTSQVLLSPQKYSDKFAPEIDFNSKIRIPVYQEETLDLTDYIYENSGFENIKDFSIEGLDEENYNIIKTVNKIKIQFSKFDSIFSKNIKFIISDFNGNITSKDVLFEIYSPIPEIKTNSGFVIDGYINESLTDEPINLYRYRGGSITKLINSSGSTKVDTLDGKFNFPVGNSGSGFVDVYYDGDKIFEINEKTGKIEIDKSLSYNIGIEINEDNLIELSVYDISNEKLFSQVINLRSQDIRVVNDFDDLNDYGIYFRLTNTDFDYYFNPRDLEYNPGALVIYRKSDLDKETLFAILMDGRMATLNSYYTLEYSSYEDYIIIKLIDKHYNKEVGELLFKIDNSYVIK